MNKADKLKEALLDNLLHHRDIEQTISNDPNSICTSVQDGSGQRIGCDLCIVSGFWAGQFVSSGDSTMDDTMMNEVDHAKAVEQFSAEDIPAFSNLAYRWNKHPDFVLAMFTFQRLFTQYDTVGKLIESLYISEDTDLNDTLARLIAKHQGYAMESASSAGLNVTTFGDLPDGFKRFFSSPTKGSACKRWQMLLRWMVRTKAPDLGLWKLPTLCN